MAGQGLGALLTELHVHAVAGRSGQRQAALVGLVDLSVLGSRCREGYLRFALARCWAQADGARDSEAVRALDGADRLAPVVIRNNPIARDLVLTMHRRARRPIWELDSLRNRFGLGKG